MSDNPTKKIVVFTDRNNCVIPDRQVRTNLYAALVGIKVPAEDTSGCVDEHIIPKVEESLSDCGWSHESIKLVTGRIGDFIEIIPINSTKRTTKVKNFFKNTLSEVF